jgi:hypothetical protein
MSTICIIDASVFVKIIAVPGGHEQHHEIMSQLRQKIALGEKLFLPLASILETGRQITRIEDDARRSKCARVFGEQMKMALNGQSPFQPLVPFLQTDWVQQWLQAFPASALGEYGLGVLSIIEDFQRMCAQNPWWNVYIWSLDQQLSQCQKWLKMAA